MADDPIIRINDIRETGHCVKGARAWFKLNGLGDKQFKRFLHEGLPASVLLATGDALAQRVVSETLKRRKG